MKEWTKPEVETLDSQETLGGGGVKIGDGTWISIGTGDDAPVVQLGST